MLKLMKKKKIVIISLIVIVIIITGIVLWLFMNNQNNTETQAYTKKEIIELISDGFANGISKNELEELIDQEISDKTMMTGEDAYLLQTPEDSLIEKYDLTDYVSSNEEYFERLETKIKENYFWEFDGENEANQDIYFVTLKTYQYGVYLSDLEEMVSLLTLEYPFENGEDQEINNYKARVIAMKLLDSHLDDYISSSDSYTIAIFFTDIDDEDTQASLAQYLMDLSGYSNSQDETINNMEINRTQRMQEYIEQAISDGTLNEEDILQI